MIVAITALFLNICAYDFRHDRDQDTLTAYIQAACLWMLFLFAVTEALSMAHGVRFRNLLPIWAVFDLAMLILLVLRRRAVRALPVWKKITDKKPRYLLCTAIVGGAVCVLAFIITPHNWDSMTYHLPRIAYWVQNRSVEHYATNCIREIASPVLGEFVNLHVYIMCRGSDCLFHLLQYFSYLTNAVLVCHIAKKLGCSRLFCMIASFLYMTMPIAYVEAVSTQVDNFAAVWLLSFVYILLDFVHRGKSLTFDRDTVGKVCTMGLCVAWGYLAKPSVCFGMVIFAVWMLVVCIARKDRLIHLIRLALCALPCVALPLIPETLRNVRTFHAYASPSTGARQLVATLKPAYLFVNFLKNFTFNMPTVLWKDSQNQFAKIATKAAGILNVELNAESIAENGIEFSLHEAPDYGMDTAISPLVMWLFILCIVWALCRIRKMEWKQMQTGYMLSATASFCVFCVFLRWEPYVGRYMISYLALICPMIAFWIEARTRGEARVFMRGAFVGVICFLCAMQAVSLTDHHREIYLRQSGLPRSYRYFESRRDKLGVYAQIVDDIKGEDCQTVGLYLLQGDAYEYPFWEMLGGRRMEHVFVTNVSKKYADSSFTPDCIIWFDALPEEPLSLNGAVYEQSEDYGNGYYLFLRESP